MFNPLHVCKAVSIIQESRVSNPKLFHHTATSKATIHMNCIRGDGQQTIGGHSTVRIADFRSLLPFVTYACFRLAHDRPFLKVEKKGEAPASPPNQDTAFMLFIVGVVLAGDTGLSICATLTG